MITYINSKDKIYSKLKTAIKVYNKFCPTPIILIPEVFDKTETKSFALDKTYF